MKELLGVAKLLLNVLLHTLDINMHLRHASNHFIKLITELIHPLALVHVLLKKLVDLSIRIHSILEFFQWWHIPAICVVKKILEVCKNWRSCVREQV